MKLEEHLEHTVTELGTSFYEIHQWLDAFASNYAFVFFDYEDVSLFDHRKFRHHKEGIVEAVLEFKDKYSEDIVRKVCEMHIRDDYQGYLPSKNDFENPDFLKKYHGREKIISS
jgi:hypothetical protein